MKNHNNFAFANGRNDKPKTSRHTCHHQRRYERQVEAEARQALRNKLSNMEQAARLVDRPGHSFKETARLVTTDA